MINKSFKSSGLLIVLGASLTLASISGQAQQTVYKWVDKDGVVQFSDSPPDNSVGVETITTDKSPPAPAPRPVASPAAAVETAPSAPAAAPTPAPAPRVDISTMSIAELDRRCNDAREDMIGPMRESEIAKCQADKRNDPEFCVRFNATFGDGGRNTNGSIRPRLFDDLPECVDAQQELNRRGR
jgi:hypothetical protein